MLQRLNKNKGNGVLEFSILIAVLAAALLAMRFYFTRAVQARYRQTAEFFGAEQYALGKTTVTNLDAEPTLINTATNTFDTTETCENLKKSVEMLDREIYGDPARGDGMYYGDDGFLYQSIMYNIGQLSGAQGDLGTTLGEMNQTGIAGHDQAVGEGTVGVQGQITTYQAQIADKQKEICELKRILSSGCPEYVPNIQTQCE